jgi:outer membrane receptor protein involved in Fe transport
MKKYLYILLSLIFLQLLSAQSNLATLRGNVYDENRNPLPFANIILKEINNGTAADKKGNYKIVAKPGGYTVMVSFIGYEKIEEKLTLVANRILERDYYLKSQSFEIGGIEVVADNEFIPLSPETKTTVTSGEIEHIQASSLNDVMELTPGVETSNPTLNSVEQATIRGGDPLGTQIVLDGVPISNNANLQVGVGLSTANSGVDLRSIPAENIKEVEVIRGIPSAQYGDLIDGLLIVKTRAVPHAPRVKFKYNPNVYETNLSGGVQVQDWVFNGNLNVASSSRDVRIEGDGYTRIAAQLTAELASEEMGIKNILYFTRSFDERKEQPGYALREAWFNRDVNFKYTGNFNYNFSSFSQLEAKFSASYTKQDSYEQQLVSRDNIVISDRIEEGTQEGRIVFGTYLGKKEIKGDVFNLFADLNYRFRFFTGDFLNSWIAGVNWRNDFNRGEGIVFDPLFPPSLSIPTPRIRTYEDIPAYNILSLYLEDKITGRLWKPFTLQIGARYEVYRPNGFNLSGLWGDGDLIDSYNGSFLNPRFNFSYNLFDDTQIRLSYGVTSKSPPMGMIFAQDKYYDFVDTVSVVNPQAPDSNFSLISTFIRQQANPNLQAYRQVKYEVSLDQQIGSLGFTITGYFNDTRNSFTNLSQPTTFFKTSYPNWPDPSLSNPKDTLIDTYNSYSNFGWSEVSGFEFSMRTRRLPVINAVFKLDAAYIYEERGTDNGYYFGSQRFVDALGLDVLPMYNSIEYYSKDLLINYRLEIQAESLGMWFTLHVQQKLIEIDGRRNYDDTLAIGYFSSTGDLIDIPEGDRINPVNQQMRRIVEPYELNEEDKPNKFLFNFKVSKSLWKGAAISFFVNNFLNNRPLYSSRRRSPNFPSYTRRNPEIFYGIEFHSSLQGIW